MLWLLFFRLDVRDLSRCWRRRKRRQRSRKELLAGAKCGKWKRLLLRFDTCTGVRPFSTTENIRCHFKLCVCVASKNCVQLKQTRLRITMPVWVWRCAFSNYLVCGTITKAFCLYFVRTKISFPHTNHQNYSISACCVSVDVGFRHS